MRRLGIVLASALLAGAIACGGDTDSPQATPAPSTAPPTTAAGTTKAEYVTKVNKICEDVEKESENIPEPKSADDYLASVTKIADLFDDAQKQLREIEPPAADAAEIEEKFLSVNDKQSKILRDVLPKLETAAEKNDKSAAENAFLEAITELGQLAEKQDKFAKQYGLTACGS